MRRPLQACNARCCFNPRVRLLVVGVQYSFNIVPVMGQLITQNRDAYQVGAITFPQPACVMVSICLLLLLLFPLLRCVQYLVESIRKFPTQDKFAAMIRTAGFSMVNYQNLTFGVVAIHSGFKFPQKPAA